MRRLFLAVGLILATYVVWSEAQGGETLAERKRWRGEAEYARTDVRQTADRCGAVIELDFDRASFRGFPSGSSVHTNCLMAHHALKALCETDPEARKVILSGVRKVVCAFSRKTTVAFDGTTLRLEANPSDPDLGISVRDAITRQFQPAAKATEIAIGN